MLLYIGKFKYITIILVLAVSFLLPSTKKSYALVCESALTFQPVVIATSAAITAQINAMVIAYNTNATATANATTVVLVTRIELFNTRLRAALAEFWDRLREALRNMTAEISASITDESRNLGSLLDARIQENIQAHIQKRELDAKMRYRPTEQVCISDTINPDYGLNTKISKAVQRGYERDFTKYSGNHSTTIGALGPVEYFKKNWDDYIKTFCDPNGNNAFANCDAGLPSPNPYEDMDISVTKTFLTDETMDIADDKKRLAADVLIKNIVYNAPEVPIQKDALRTATGREVLLERRSKRARLNLVASVFSEIMGDRVPLGKEAPYTKALREAVGHTIEAHDQPSKHEARQAIVEHLWDPEYAYMLGNSESAILRQQVNLQSYSLMMLNDMIEKTEKIAMLYAVQLSVALDKTTLVSPKQQQ